MRREQELVFPPFRLDPLAGQLWRGKKLVPLRPKTFAVLCYLIEQAGRIVTSAELQKAVWPDTYGAESLPRECIHELRQALGDQAATPRFIETVGRRQGYRFIAPLQAAPPVQNVKFKVQNTSSSPPLVGREAELQQLHGWWAKAQRGERQVVFVTGEPGIGKTTLVEAFVAQVQSPRSKIQGPSLATGNWQLASSAGGSALSTMGRGKHTYPSWKRWDGCVGSRGGSRLLLC